MIETTEGSLATEGSSNQMINTILSYIGWKGYFYTITINPLGIPAYDGTDVIQQCADKFYMEQNPKKFIYIKEKGKNGKVHAHGIVVTTKVMNPKKIQVEGFQIYIEKIKKFFTVRGTKECICNQLDPDVEDCGHKTIYKPEYNRERMQWFYYLNKDNPQRCYFYNA